jgi:kynureninase
MSQSYKKLFRRFLNTDPGRLHFAAHSHHPWPDVTFEAHTQAWEDAARLMDDKWDTIFGRVIPEIRIRVSSLLGLPDPGSLVFAPNTHEFVIRLFSCLTPPVRIVTTDAEFHSFDRQVRRWAEAGLTEIVRVGAEPFESFPERMQAALGGATMIYLSHVFFDSGYVVEDLAAILAEAPIESFVVVDGYHGFMALPTDLNGLSERVFYLAGGYKYAMAGEGACFMHCPPSFGERPIDTGWFAGYDELTKRGATIAYGGGGDRFWGATFDPSGLYRLLAVLKLTEAEGLSPAVIHGHVDQLQQQLLSTGAVPGELIPGVGTPRGNFLTFRTAEAESIDRRLHDRGVIVDHRGDRLRIGFGIYHDTDDVERLASALVG